jgi:uncharacterized protein YcnI
MRIHAQAVVAISAATVFALLSAIADAHIMFTVDHAAAGSHATIELHVGHGCDGKPTTKIQMLIPEGVSQVKTQAPAGWRVEYVRAGGGRISEVDWLGGTLPANAPTNIELQMLLPAAPGTTLFFKTIQTCEDKTVRWIDLPDAANPAAHLELPAPALLLK